MSITKVVKTKPEDGSIVSFLVARKDGDHGSSSLVKFSRHCKNVYYTNFALSNQTPLTTLPLTTLPLMIASPLDYNFVFDD